MFPLDGANATSKPENTHGVGLVVGRDVEAEAGSGHFLMEAEAEVRKICRFRFHIIQKSIL